MNNQCETVRVHLSERSYDIQIGAGNLDETGRFLAERAKATHVVLITDDNVQKPHAIRVAESLGEQDIETDVIAVEPGEESKSLDVAAALWQGLLDLGADRKTVIAAVGGGVVGDLAGFIAATYARGLRFLQVPTSLLAQVDSSVGGKVGIDLPKAKNMVGAFLQPLGVMIDTDVLTTLPDREFRNGMAEVIKYGVILDADFFDYLEANAAAILEHQPDVLRYMIARCCQLKAEIVEKDEREETGLRAVLNFGHTFGHAFEMLSWRSEETKSADSQAAKSFTNHAESPVSSLLHGEAVAIGMICSARLAERLGRIDASLTGRLSNLLQTFGLPLEVPSLDRGDILNVMMNDKKVQHGRLHFVLPSRMGHVELVGDIGSADIEAALENE